MRSKTPLTVLQVLTKARKKIQAYENWHRGSLYRYGDSCAWSVDKTLGAPQGFCAIGALQYVSTTEIVYNGAVVALYMGLPKSSKDIATYNDSRKGRRGHQQILKVFDRAISKLQEET